MWSKMWRRSDITGLEACSIHQESGSRVLSGMAIYTDQTGPLRVRYKMHCAPDWTCQAAEIERWGPQGARAHLSLKRRADGDWERDGERISGVSQCLDIDLGFTPATNTTTLKRLNLRVGDSADLTAVWLDETSWTFKPLKQRYERLGAHLYKYVSLESGYEAELRVDAFGGVEHYPGFWEAVNA